MKINIIDMATTLLVHELTEVLNRMITAANCNRRFEKSLSLETFQAKDRWFRHFPGAKSSRLPELDHRPKVGSTLATDRRQPELGRLRCFQAAMVPLTLATDVGGRRKADRRPYFGPVSCRQLDKL